MKLRYVSKFKNMRRPYYGVVRLNGPSATLFLFSLRVSRQLDRGKIDPSTLMNFRRALMRIVGAEKEYDGYIYYPLDSFKTLEDLAGQIHYCSDRWCAGRAASVIAAINHLLEKGAFSAN